MSENPFPVRSQESMWRDDAWNYEHLCAHGKEPDQACEACDLTLLWAARGVEPFQLPPIVAPRQHLAWWMALILVAVGGALTVVAAALLCEVIGL